MMEEKRTVKLPHNLILEGRKFLTISGVSDVDSFDDQDIVAYTDLGQLTIKGQGLNIKKLSLETGELIVEGEINSMSYTDNQPITGGILTRLFR